MVTVDAFAIEALQFFMPNRDPGLADAFIKTYGGTIGILAALSLRRLR